ncbi:hypothetical protein GWI33_014574 [Rhynchophorus ferrugineus]|uniref:hydroxymethylbilane synthase n=1 Tax=Rhynchophorus ferrugineus TaxID=354439 RepID=A0A834M8Z0_RHYFE|nr:hypothetical protein GWI33_014574 [Rhynchophorus ferrugineus]
MSGDQVIHVGSRKSELALIQTRYVISLLQKICPDKKFEIVTMNTLGDKILDIPLPKIGEKSLFTKELESALLTGRVDFVVHSLKDLPTSLPSGLAIGAVLKREDPRDVLVLQKDLKNYSLSTLPKDSVIGTSSLRRTAQLAKKYPHLKVENIRGNLNTRLKKLDDLGKYQAIVLASAGLIRIGWKDRISEMLNSDDFLYAVGQGALAVECRANDAQTIKLLEALYDLPTAIKVVSERSFLKTLGGGCSAPVAVSTNLKIVKEKQVEVSLKGAVWSLDGKDEIIDEAMSILSILDDIKCAACPYNNGTNGISDIECCMNNVNSSMKEPPTKKIKRTVPNEVLENDPHEKCPLEIPIGSDFMGQCPYLQGETDAIHSQFSLSTDEEIRENAKKCPFLKHEAEILNSNTIPTEILNGNEDITTNLFAGLISHHNITVENLNKAKLLGETLAKKLIEKGALEIMNKAQAIIHSKQT